jgi:hypothetical protein
VLGWHRRCKLAHTFLWEYTSGRLGVFLTAARDSGAPLREARRGWRGWRTEQAVVSFFGDSASTVALSIRMLSPASRALYLAAARR